MAVLPAKSEHGRLPRSHLTDSMSVATLWDLLPFARMATDVCFGVMG